MAGTKTGFIFSLMGNAVRIFSAPWYNRNTYSETVQHQAFIFIHRPLSFNGNAEF
jgi:hypothetical protein